MRATSLCVLMLSLCIPVALAQSPFAASKSERYVPQLGGIMTAAQLQHLKLWSAASAGNWPLAAYELRQLKQSLADAATLYSGIPISNVTTLGAPLQAMSEAVAAKNGKEFAKAFGELTNDCNGCHRSMERGFIVIRVPAAQPFANQDFGTKGKP